MRPMAVPTVGRVLCVRPLLCICQGALVHTLHSMFWLVQAKDTLELCCNHVQGWIFASEFPVRGKSLNYNFYYIKSTMSLLFSFHFNNQSFIFQI